MRLFNRTTPIDADIVAERLAAGSVVVDVRQRAEWKPRAPFRVLVARLAAAHAALEEHGTRYEASGG